LPAKSMVFRPRRGTIDKGKLEGRSRGSVRGAHLRWKETEAAGFCRRAAGDGGESRLKPAQRRCSRDHPTTGTSRICAARPCGAPGVVVFTWRCFVAANRRGQRRRRRRLTRPNAGGAAHRGAFPRRSAQGRGAARLNRARRR
jgi:hypothetical protein